MLEEIKELRGIVAAQREQLRELREFANLEQSQRHVESSEQATRLAQLEASLAEKMAKEESWQVHQKAERAARDEEREKLRAEKQELIFRMQALSEALETNKQTVDHKYPSLLLTKEEQETRKPSPRKSSAQSRLVGKLQSQQLRFSQRLNADFHLFASSSLPQSKRMRVWEKENHARAARVCGIVDESTNDHYHRNVISKNSIRPTIC